MIKENTTSKYLLYAIGEIILVVIGILIALQVNNWKEERKARTLEIVLLENLKKDLTLDTLDINFNIKYHSTFINEEKKLLNFLTSDLDYPATVIDYNAALTTPLIIVLHESTFANLQNNDIGILTNNSLRNDISRFYDFFSTAIKKIENDLPAYETYNVKLPYFLKYCKLDPNAPEMILSNPDSKDYYNPEFKKKAIVLHKFDEAKQDDAFKIILNESIFFRQVTIDFYINMITRINELTNEIDKALVVLK
ncbi:DUF6090 family protein [Psychroserpens burtonensis]|uniref:DUF6090 family protein n=1 Tax=Psychroserpens burtonensis TaxID=49278 RepID=UPI0004196443|nr:DUF6090 family protein [Psychroserpens burtonensis]